MMCIPKICNCCNRKVVIEVSEFAFNNWNAGALAQDALRELTDDEREILISGICGTCFDELTAVGEE
jgi:hypothetical protein